jgi:C-terminal processing protease CtpA/Prc
VGYLKLDAFASEKDAGSAGAAAMNFLVHTDALIIDLRENGGGGISMFQLLMSYLHDGRQQLSGIHIRASDTDMQIWTHGFVSGPRLADVPVWVLVSERTFSAAEAIRGILANEQDPRWRVWLERALAEVVEPASASW